MAGGIAERGAGAPQADALRQTAVRIKAANAGREQDLALAGAAVLLHEMMRSNGLFIGSPEFGRPGSHH